MISVSNLIQTFRDALAADGALTSWCQAQFSEQQKIFVGIDEKNPPGQADCPLVILRPDPASEGLEAGTFVYRLLVDMGIMDETVDVTDNIVEYAGIYKLDHMAGLVWDALVNAQGNLVLGKREYTLEPVKFFPLMLAGLDIEISVPNVIGGEITM